MQEEAGLIVSRLLIQKQQREGLTDKQLAAVFGVNPSTIWRWRNGDISKKAAALIFLVLHEHTTKVPVSA